MGNSPLPQSIENECAAIGSAILDPKAASYLAKTLTPDDFYRPANRDVFRAVLDLCRSGTEIDLPQLAARMEVSGSLGRAGGVDYLVELFESVPSAVMVDCYADIVKDRSVKRSAIELLHNAERSAYGDVSALELLDGAIGGLMTLRQTNGGNSGSVGDFVDGALDPVADSINFGVRPLDRIIGGLEPGTLHIIGAKPGTGKTQLLVASMISMGECGVPCGAISAEMGASIDLARDRQLVLRRRFSGAWPWRRGSRNARHPWIGGPRQWPRQSSKLRAERSGHFEPPYELIEIDRLFRQDQGPLRFTIGTAGSASCLQAFAFRQGRELLAALDQGGFAVAPIGHRLACFGLKQFGSVEISPQCRCAVANYRYRAVEHGARIDEVAQ